MEPKALAMPVELRAAAFTAQKILAAFGTSIVEAAEFYQDHLEALRNAQESAFAPVLAKKWQDEGVPALSVAVNVSAVQFRQTGFCELIQRGLRETELDPQYLELELTQSALIEFITPVSEQRLVDV